MVIHGRTDSTLEFGDKSICFNDDWPDVIYLMATRKWEHILIDGNPFELQTTFFSGQMSELDHGLVSTFLTLVANDEFRVWASTVGTKFIKEELTKNWLSDQTLNSDLNNRFQVQMTGVTTLPSGPPTGSDNRSLHIGFILTGEHI